MTRHAMSFLEEVKSFRKNRLKTVETRVTTIDGRQLVESNAASCDVQIVRALHPGSAGNRVLGYVVDYKPDLQVGQVLSFLSFGSQDVAQDASVLKSHRVTHILNLATGVPNSFEGSDEQFVYKRVDLLDLPTVNIRRIFEECFEYIDTCRPPSAAPTSELAGVDHGGHALHAFVHCNAGVSRSATIVIAYVMTYCSMRFDDALAYVRTKRSVARPNDGFARQLRAYGTELFEKCARDQMTG